MRRTEQHETRDRDVDPDDDGHDAADDREHAPAHPAGDDLARLLGEPAAIDDVGLERPVEIVDCGRELGHPGGTDDPVLRVVAERA